MKILLCFLCANFVAVTFSRQPQGYRLVPRRAVMFGGYYSNPIFGRTYDYAPQGSMSAVVTRDTVATNSYAGNPQYPPIDVLPLEEKETVEQYPEKNEAEAVPPQYVPPETSESNGPVQVDLQAPQEELLTPPEAEDVALIEEVSTEAAPVTKATKRVPKKKVVRPPPTQVDEEEEEDGGLGAGWPFANRKGAVPSYNAFFPITITGGATSRTRSQGQGVEDYYPGSATAIANAFSTGKGGVATSHATSFGDPYLASLVRNGLLNFRTKKTQES